MEELAGLLSRERRLLEVLLFKLVEARHLLASGDTRFITWAANEADRAVERVREAELMRAAMVQRLAGELNVSVERLTLSELAHESVEPYRTIFSDHRRAFLELVAEIEEVTRENRRLIGKGQHQVEEVLRMITEGQEGTDVGRTYGSQAHAFARRRPSPVRVDQAL